MSRRIFHTILAILTVLLLTQCAMPTVPVVMAAEDIGAGMPLETHHLRIENLPAVQVPTDAVSNLERLLGQAPRVILQSGELITQSMVGPPVELTGYERGLALPVQVESPDFQISPGEVVAVKGVLELSTERGLVEVTILIPGHRLIWLSPKFRQEVTGVAMIAFDMRPVPIHYRDSRSEDATSSKLSLLDDFLQIGSPIEVVEVIRAAGGTLTLVESPSSNDSLLPNSMMVTYKSMP